MSGAEPWSRYWAREASGACLPAAPDNVQRVLTGVWTALAGDIRSGGRVLDVAAGGGAVLRALGAAGRPLELTGIDYADVGAAAAALGVTGGIDAHSLPFPAESFDAVTSQFGLEYCGPAAWAEAVRVLVPGGQLCLVCHHHASRAVAQNRDRLAAMQALADAGLFALADGLASGRGEDAALVAAVMAARAAHQAQSISSELPQALGHWARSGRPDAVAAIRAEAEAEMARLAAMQAAALDDDGLAERLAWLTPMTATTDVLAGPDGAPLAWRVRGVRG